MEEVAGIREISRLEKKRRDGEKFGRAKEADEIR